MDIFLKQTVEDMFYAEFEIIKQNEIIGKISIIIACYTYLFAGYEPGVKHVDTKKTYNTKMVDKREQEKYNPNWINEYKQK